MLLPDGVHNARFDRLKVHTFYENSRGLRSMFENEVEFTKWLLSYNTVVLEMEEGYLVFYDMVPGHSASFVALFYDQKLSTRTGLIRDCLLWAFTSLDLTRIAILVPSSFFAFLRWAKEKLSFKEEGRLRSYKVARGQPVNYVVLSMLSEEVL